VSIDVGTAPREVGLTLLRLNGAVSCNNDSSCEPFKNPVVAAVTSYVEGW